MSIGTNKLLVKFKHCPCGKKIFIVDSRTSLICSKECIFYIEESKDYKNTKKRVKKIRTHVKYVSPRKIYYTEQLSAEEELIRKYADNRNTRI